MSREPLTPHLATEDLAALVEGRLADDGALPLRRHVASCQECLAAYAEAVRYRAEWLADPDAFRSDPTLVETGMEVARKPAGNERHQPILRRSESIVGPRPARGWIPLWRWSAATIAATVVIAIWFWPRFPASHRPPGLPPAVARAVGDYSALSLVIPGGEQGAVASEPVYRAGPSELPRDIVARLLAAHERERSQRSAYAAAAALLVNGQKAAARDHVDEGLRLGNEDADLLVLAAAISYRESDLVKAEVELRRSLRIRPNNPTATLDLGIVLSEAGRSEGAHLLASVARRESTSSLATRARLELARHSANLPGRRGDAEAGP